MLSPRNLALAAAVLLSVDDGCSSSTATKQRYDEQGVAYRLYTIDGRGLPTASSTGSQWSVQYAHLCLFPGTRYRLAIQSRLTIGPAPEPVVTYGDYSFVDGSGSLGGAPAVRSANRDTITVSESWLYVRDDTYKPTACLAETTP